MNFRDDDRNDSTYLQNDMVSSDERSLKFEGDVYYDPKVNLFVQLRRKGKKLVFGGPCEYYEDAQTCTLTYIRSVRCLKFLVRVENIETFKKAAYDGIGWCVKGAFKEFDDLNALKKVKSRRYRLNRHK